MVRRVGDQSKSYGSARVRHGIDEVVAPGKLTVMAERTVQLVLHYDGARFAGWQRQPDVRTVQGVIEETLSRLCNAHTRAIGAGRTDAGVHARGQAVSASVPEAWTVEKLRRAVNALLPDDVWVVAAYDMEPAFHARYSALAAPVQLSRGNGRGRAVAVSGALGVGGPATRSTAQSLDQSADAMVGEHCFRAYAVRGTAPETDDHRCIVHSARWGDRPGGLTFEIEANRFLHHMVRFVVGTMVEAASGVRARTAVGDLLVAPDNSDVSPPAPPHALCLEHVEYPRGLYRQIA